MPDLSNISTVFSITVNIEEGQEEILPHPYTTKMVIVLS